MVRIPKQTDAASFGRSVSLDDEDTEAPFADAIQDAQADLSPAGDPSLVTSSGDVTRGADAPATEDLVTTLLHVYEASGRDRADAQALIETTLAERGANGLADQIQLLVRDERPTEVTADSFEKLGLPGDAAGDAARIFDALEEQTGNPSVAWEGVWSLIVEGAEGQPASGLAQSGYEGVDAALAAVMQAYGLDSAE